MAVFGQPCHGASRRPGRASLRSYLMLLQRHGEMGLPPARRAESLQKWRGMAVFQRNSSVCTLLRPGVLRVGVELARHCLLWIRSTAERSLGAPGSDLSGSTAHGSRSTFVGWFSREVVCCESSAFILH